MLIPRGLILYRAQRHQKHFPANQKSGHYSNKLSFPHESVKEFENLQQKHQKKFVQEISLNVNGCNPKKNKVLRILSKFSHITKCTINLGALRLGKKPVKLMIKVFRRIFKVLKKIKSLKMDASLITEETRAYKNLFLLNNLETLKISPFSYREGEKNMESFLKATKSASRRRSWFHLRSLHLDLSPKYPQISDNPEGRPLQSLKKLLALTEYFKKCSPNLFKYSSFHLKLPSNAKINSEEAKLLMEIAKILPSITNIKSSWWNNFWGVLEMVQHSKNLKEVEIFIWNQLEHQLDLSMLTKLPNFQKLTLTDYTKQENMSSSLYKNTLAQLQTLKCLTALSLKFQCLPTKENEKFELSRVILDLPHLKSLELIFINCRRVGDGLQSFQLENEMQRYKLENGNWLQDTCKAISEKSKLEKLSLSLSSFDFVKPELLFPIFCQSLIKLTRLSDFKLEIHNADIIKDNEISTFCQCMSKLTNIQHFDLELEKRSHFGTKALVLLIDCLMKSCSFLSTLYLRIRKIKIDDQLYLKLFEAANQMKCLNKIGLFFTGDKNGSNFDWKNLEAEIQKKREAEIYYYSSNQGIV